MMEKGEKKVHFKMYKAGRQWLVAGIAAVGLGAGMATLFSGQIADTQTVYAATQGEQAEDTQSQSTKTAAGATVANANQSDTNNSQSLNATGTAATATGEGEEQVNSTTDQTEHPSPQDDITQTVTSSDAGTTGNGASETPTSETSDSGDSNNGTSDTDTADQSMVVTVNGQNLDDLKGSFTYHSNPDNPNAGIKDNGQVILTTAEKRQSGNLTLNNQIDLDYDFDLTGTITIGNGDGVSFGFHTGNTDEVGHNGGSLGFAGLENAIGWKADMYHNDNGGQNDNDTVVINGEKVPYFSPDPAGFRKFGAFVYTGDNSITIETNAKSAQSISSAYDTIHVHYAASTHTLTVEFSKSSQPNPANTLIWSEDITEYVSEHQLVSFFIAGSTGDEFSKQGFKLGTFTYNAVGVVHVEYQDKDGNRLLTGDDIHGLIGSTVKVLGTPEYQKAINFLSTPEQGGYVPANINNQGNVTFQRTNPQTLIITMKKEHKATIHFVDDATNTQQADLGTKEVSWTDDTAVEHMDDIENRIAELEQSGYTLTTDGRPSDGQYTIDGNYTIHFTHQTRIIGKRTVDRTITYRGLPELKTKTHPSLQFKCNTLTTRPKRP
ncbi:lectin-like domain-containing protein [Lacticaseibacillus suibinensis]|uniref:lectin-like domain-containing protein n=1 Tax=Lacticaseibacillus suibinensis TaxID=2486011 RepID=UPI0013DE74F1|nr:KxYKxGKxW signal peptide domain-containing protein [Lacticaseibacillus suibinensis]